jgi:hypothetical protein
MANSTAALYERTGTGAYASSITGATARTPQTSLAGANSTQNSITLRFTETLTRTATGVDVAFEAVNTATSTTVMSFTFSDTSPNNNGLLTGSQTNPSSPAHSPTFSAAGFGFSGEYIGTSNASAQFSNVQVSYSSPSPGSSQSITFVPIADRIYGGPAIELAATTSSGLPVGYTVLSGPASLNGNSLSIHGVGEVIVRASQAGNIDYLPATPVEQSFTVSKAPATITLANLSHTFDGSAKSATVTTHPANRSVDLRYNGEQTAPYQIGSYEVTAVINDELYEGSASGTLVISAANSALQTWRLLHFGDIADTGSGADSADPDADGLSNLMEFALGLDPHSPSTIPATLALEEGSIDYRYTRLKAAAAEFDYAVERSDGLEADSWTSQGIVVSPTPISDDGTRETIRVTVPAGNGRRFIRLKVSPKP